VTAAGNKKQIEVPGPPLPLRMVVTQVVDEAGAVLAEWWLLTNVAGGDADAATIGRWYAWRWAIETCQADSTSSDRWCEATRAGYDRRRRAA